MLNSSRRSHSRVAVFLCIFTLGVLADQVSKWLAVKYLTSYDRLSLLGNFIGLTLVRNSGATLSFGASTTWLISLFAIAASIGLLWMGLKSTSRWWIVTCALAASGAIGNAIDRVIYADGFLNGKVVDFINYGWSVGNVADIILFVAAVGMIVGFIDSKPTGIMAVDKFILSKDDEIKHADDHVDVESTVAQYASEDSFELCVNDDDVDSFQKSGIHS